MDLAAVASRAIARGQCVRLLSPRTPRIGGSFQRWGAEHHVARLLSTLSSCGGDATTGPRVVLEGRIDGRLQPRTCAIDAAFTESRLYQDQLADVSEEDVQRVCSRFAAQLDATLADVRSVEPLVTTGGAPGTNAADLDGKGAVGLALPQAVVDELKYHALPILEKLEDERSVLLTEDRDASHTVVRLGREDAATHSLVHGVVPALEHVEVRELLSHCLGTASWEVDAVSVHCIDRQDMPTRFEDAPYGEGANEQALRFGTVTNSAKVMVYLDPVNKYGGPLTYVRGSHLWRDPADATDAAIRATVRNFEDCYKLGSDARRTFACLPPEWQRKHTFGLDHAASSEFVSLLRDSSTTFVSERDADAGSPADNNPFADADAGAVVAPGVNTIVFNPHGAHAFGIVRAPRPALFRALQITVARREARQL